ncbi:MAG: hypothetical protein ACXIU8_09905 [Alkalilacustris sp.]
MTHDTPDIAEADPEEDLVTTLSALLAREAEILRTAEFDALPELLAEKEALAGRLAERLGQAPTLGDAETLRHLQAAAQRNAVLLEAARAGLKSAGDQVRSLMTPPQPLQTYDGTGRRARIAPAPPATERRA